MSASPIPTLSCNFSVTYTDKYNYLQATDVKLLSSSLSPSDVDIPEVARGIFEAISVEIARILKQSSKEKIELKGRISQKDGFLILGTSDHDLTKNICEAVGDLAHAVMTDVIITDGLGRLKKVKPTEEFKRNFKFDEIKQHLGIDQNTSIDQLTLIDFASYCLFKREVPGPVVANLVVHISFPQDPVENVISALGKFCFGR